MSTERFIRAMVETLGCAPEHIEPGRFHRFPTSPKKASKPGYCKLFEDGLGGFFGDFRTGLFQTWTARDRATMTPAERLRHDQQVAEAKRERDREQAERWARNRPRIKATWDQGHNLVMGDPPTLYLKRRGLGGMWPLPACLRYHPALPYWENGEVIGTYPAMLAKFRGVDGRCVAIHQTYLTRDGHKADLPTVKKMSPTAGSLAGGCIPLADPFEHVLGVAEGIETALCAGAASALPVVATYSAGCLSSFQWPRGVKRLVIFGDNDESGTGQAAAHKLESRARAAGLSVSVLIPQTPGEDWADVYARRDERRIDAVIDNLERAHFDEQGGGTA
ncbi:MAG: toprim domain-containing protein [Burkholderiales bacterium]|nr:toprim domain-containing protein [Burkholderiales bacterium]